MNENHRDLISIGFTVSIVLMAGVIASKFLLPLAWAGIIAIASWPAYERVERWLGKRRTLASIVLTTIVTLVVMIPLVFLTIKVVHEVSHFMSYLIAANINGLPVPAFINSLPWGSDYLREWWQTNLAHQGAVAEFFNNGHAPTLKSFSGVAKTVGSQVAQRSVIFGFAIVCLFFFYRDGKTLVHHIHTFGRFCLRDRWDLYAHDLPVAIKATVNGLVLVGISVGIIMGVCYAIAGVPFAALLGAATAILAMIPFGAPVAFIVVSLILLAKGSFWTAIIILAIGGAVMFVADHFVRPVIIGSATQLHFLAVLFGILGGVETLGLVGLFVGPVVMVLFSTLWKEPQFN
ncbi:MAG: AI-2E family transporter [Pseudomonadota bacterium]|nr:AI-2E family transporter [Pseudomonadota bacterium]